MIVENGLSEEAAVDAIAALLADPGRCVAMGAAAKRLARPDVAEHVADLLAARFP